MASRTRPVLAVFGGAERATLAAAESVGREIALRGAVVLTGGMRPGADAVKERALRGAESAGSRARWIGVPGREAAGGDPVSTPTSLVLPLGYGDRRNCVEAHLCDAAIAFPGGPGTVSEVAFCLAFGRPVVLVGFADAGTLFPVEDDPAARARYVQEAHRRVPVPTGTGTTAPGIDRLIIRAYDALSRPVLEQRVHHVAIGTPAGAIVDLAGRSALDAGLRGEFPELPERARAGAAYRAWLDDPHPPIG